MLYLEVKTHHYEIQRLWKAIEYLLSRSGGGGDTTELENRIQALENKTQFITYDYSTGKTTINANNVYVSYTKNGTSYHQTLQEIIQQIGSGGSSNLTYFDISDSKTGNNITLTIKPNSQNASTNPSISIGDSTNLVQLYPNGNIAVKDSSKTVNLNVGDLIKVKHIGLPSRTNNPQ